MFIWLYFALGLFANVTDAASAQGRGGENEMSTDIFIFITSYMSTFELFNVIM